MMSSAMAAYRIALFSICPLQFTEAKDWHPFTSTAPVNDSNSWKSVQMWDFVTVDNVTDS